MEKYNWTETALHHHMLGETPKVLFLHWAVTGKPTDIINQAKQITMQTSTYQNLTGPTRTQISRSVVQCGKQLPIQKTKSVITRPRHFSLFLYYKVGNMFNNSVCD
jgi:Domain of Unknown Function (DUF1259)